MGFEQRFVLHGYRVDVPAALNSYQQDVGTATSCRWQIPSRRVRGLATLVAHGP